MSVIAPNGRVIKRSGRRAKSYLVGGYRPVKGVLMEIERLQALTISGGSDERLLPEELEEIKIKVPFKRKMYDDDRTLKYRTSNGVNLTTHMGQRKLLMSEIEFLTLYGKLSTNVVYAGSAPGIHIPFLIRLFPRHKFYLYDPNPFCVRESPKIKIYNDYFTDDTASELRRKFDGNLLFISDIRRTPEEDNFDNFEKLVGEDLDMQRRWIGIMKPKMSMLKFRLPFTLKTPMEYLDGDVHLQVWAPHRSSETRLITDGRSTRMYDPKQYENIMYRFNLCTRHQVYKHNIPLDIVDGLDYCYDCNAEIFIFKEYLKKIKNIKIINPLMIAELMNATSEACRRSLRRAGHGKILNDSSIIMQLNAQT